MAFNILFFVSSSMSFQPTAKIQRKQTNKDSRTGVWFMILIGWRLKSKIQLVFQH